MAKYSKRTMKQYKWQWEFTNIFDRPALTLHRIRWLIRKACDIWDVPYPVVVEQKKTEDKEASHYICDTERVRQTARIQLLDVHMNLPAALHEVAHHIQAARFPEANAEDDHGPTWLGIYIHLLDQFYVLPRHATEPSLESKGLSFNRVLPPPPKKKAQKQ